MIDYKSIRKPVIYSLDETMTIISSWLTLRKKWIFFFHYKPIKHYQGRKKWQELNNLNHQCTINEKTWTNNAIVYDISHSSLIPSVLLMPPEYCPWVSKLLFFMPWTILSHLGKTINMYVYLYVPIITKRIFHFMMNECRGCLPLFRVHRDILINTPAMHNSRRLFDFSTILLWADLGMLAISMILKGN